jgi:threonine/homoserine/homoserine lactone efflux protein
MDANHLLLFVAAGLLLNLTPGPDVLYLVTHAMRSGLRAGLVAALGIAAGCFVHIFAAALGVSALMAASATAFSLLKWAGVAYLVYIGTRMLMAKASAYPQNAMNNIAKSVAGSSARPLKSIFFQGFWTNALNPKVALFFLAFVPQFIGPAVVNKPLAFLLLGFLFNFNGLWVNAGWALVAAWSAKRLGAVQRSMHWLERAAGLMFVGFGIKLALSDKPLVP